jgi:Tol biopolymer transport system component
MASSEAIGKAQSSKARVDSIWAIFQLDSDTGRTKMISTGFRQPVGIDVAPDSAQLLVAGYYSGQQGLWLIDVTSGKVDRVALGNFSGPRFGDTDILALRFPDRGRAVAVQFSRS